MTLYPPPLSVFRLLPPMDALNTSPNLVEGVRFFAGAVCATSLVCDSLEQCVCVCVYEGSNYT